MPIKWADDEQPKSRIRWESEAAPQMPQNAPAAAVAAPPQESREDELRRKALEDITAGMGAWEKRALGVDRGVTRIGQAVKQQALHAVAGNLDSPLVRALLPPEADSNFRWSMEKLGLADKARAAAKDYDQQLALEAQDWAAGAGKDPNVFAGDLVGSIAATAPLGGPAIKGGSIIGNAALAGVNAGLVGAATTPVDDGSTDFGAAKRRQVLTGAAFGAGVSGALQGAGKVIEEIGMGNALRRGYNWLARKANATPQAAEGEALAQKFGVEMTPGQVSGGKGQLAAENMARQSIFTRDAVFDTDMKIADQYASAIQKQLDKLSKKGADVGTAGVAIKNEVNEAIEKLSARRAKLAAADFGKVDQLAKGSPVIDPKSYREELQKLIDENSIGDEGSDVYELAKALGRRMDASGTIANASNALKSRRYLSQIAGGKASFAGSAGQDIQKRAAAKLLSALDQDIEAATGKGGSLGQALKEANERYMAYSQRINAIKEGPIGSILGKDLVDKSGYGFGDVAPEKIFERFTQLHPSQVELAMTHMSPEAAGQVKRAYVQRALESAQMETAGGGAVQTNVRPLTFIKALQRDGSTADRKKLQAIFSATELKEIDDLMNVGRRIGDRTGANTSGTAAMSQAMGIVEKLRSLTLKGLVEVGGAALGTREIARVMADSGGRRALMELRSLPAGSQRARQLASYISGIAAADEFGQNETSNVKR